MVTAGIFLLLRVSFLLEYNLRCAYIIIFAGVLTCLLAAYGAYFQTDTKRIVAYSTCSQLGLMVSGIGFSSFSQTMYHLTTHAFFKALLFFMAGILIHSILNNQDIRVGSEALTRLPSSEAFTGTLIASCTLFGFPTFSGFFSKDFLIESVFEADHFLSIPAFLLVCFASGFTAAYSIKAIIKTYFYNDGILTTTYGSASYAFYSSKLLTVFSTLLVFSTCIGYFLHHFFENGTFYTVYHGLFYGHDTLANDHASFELFLLPTYVSTLGAIFSFLSNRDNISTLPSNFYLKKYFSLFKRDYSLNEFLNYLLSRPTLSFGYHISYKTIDRGFLEMFGPKGLWAAINLLFSAIRKLHSGSIYNYFRLNFRAYILLIILFIIISIYCSI